MENKLNNFMDEISKKRILIDGLKQEIALLEKKIEEEKESLLTDKDYDDIIEILKKDKLISIINSNFECTFKGEGKAIKMTVNFGESKEDYNIMIDLVGTNLLKNTIHAIFTYVFSHYSLLVMKNNESNMKITSDNTVTVYVTPFSDYSEITICLKCVKRNVRNASFAYNKESNKLPMGIYVEGADDEELEIFFLFEIGQVEINDDMINTIPKLITDNLDDINDHFTTIESI